VVVNSFYQAFPGMKAHAWVYNTDMSQKFAQDAAVDVTPDSATRVLTIPALDGLSSTYFVRLQLEDSAGKTVSTNFYWLSTKPDELDWDNSTWYYTPEKTYADFTALNNLPPVELKYSATSDNGTTRVTVENPSPNLAFAVHLKVSTVKRDEEDVREETEILPVIWEDNYFPLMPGEKRTVTATYRAPVSKSPPTVQVDGWNVK
jgi:exo-1,4-beta-D-glucosaminidase